VRCAALLGLLLTVGVAVIEEDPDRGILKLFAYSARPPASSASANAGRTCLLDRALGRVMSIVRLLKPATLRTDAGSIAWLLAGGLQVVQRILERPQIALDSLVYVAATIRMGDEDVIVVNTGRVAISIPAVQRIWILGGTTAAARHSSGQKPPRAKARAGGTMHQRFQDPRSSAAGADELPDRTVCVCSDRALTADLFCRCALQHPRGLELPSNPGADFDARI